MHLDEVLVQCGTQLAHICNRPRIPAAVKAVRLIPEARDTLSSIPQTAGTFINGRDPLRQLQDRRPNLAVNQTGQLSCERAREVPFLDVTFG